MPSHEWRGRQSYHRVAIACPSLIPYISLSSRAQRSEYSTMVANRPFFSIKEAVLRAGTISECSGLIRHLHEWKWEMNPRYPGGFPMADSMWTRFDSRRL